MKYLTVFLLAFLFVPYTYALENAQSFVSTITINQDTSLSIIEKIEFQTDLEKHGIYRYVPYKYSINGLNYQVDIDLDKVTDETGIPLDVKSSYESGNLNWRIGNPDVTFTGEKTYNISYKISDTLRQFPDHDELYLDITGEGWQFPIDSSSVLINSPFAQISDAKCFVGEVGKSDSNCIIQKPSKTQLQISTNQLINYGQNFTIVVSLEKPNQLIFPTPNELILKKFMDNLWLILVPIPLIFMFLTWYKFGRDKVFISPNVFDMDQKPERLKNIFEYQRIPMVYQPLTHLTPAEAGAMLDEKVDTRDIIAEIIDLARKKYLSITPISTKKIIFNQKDYKFLKLKDSDNLLPAHQKYLHNKLFEKKSEVTMSSLKGKFHITMQKVSQMIYETTTEKKYFTKNPTHVMLIYGILAVVVLVIVCFVIMVMNLIDPTLPLILVGIQILFLPIFVLSMVQKSAIGSNYAMQAKGLKATIKRGAWREKIHEKHLFFDEVLPFALAFNVVDKLARDMASLNVKPPQYLSTAGWTTRSLATDINHFGATAQKTLAFNPSSSNASGGSGFSGGSSGGGFGGGGGGSW